MIMGHYGVALAAKPMQRRLPLWLLCGAVQWLDICWAVLVMLGIEKFRIVPYLTEANWLDLYFIPYTHSVVGALLLSVLLGAVSAAFYAPRLRTFLVVAACSFSHWPLDWLVHIEDLPLFGNCCKTGLGLWRHLWISFPLELIFLWGGAFILARRVKAATSFRAAWLWVFVVALTLEECNVSFGWFGPFFTTPVAIGALSLAIYLIVALLAGLVGLTRTGEPIPLKAS